MKQMIYTAPTLEKVTLAANDILLTSGDDSGEYEVRGALNDFDVSSSQYQKQSWTNIVEN